MTKPTFPPRADTPEPAQGVSRRTALAGLAVLPAALPAAAEAAADPIFAAIERHKKAAIPYDAAVHARSSFDDIRKDPDEEHLAELDRLDRAVKDAWRACAQSGTDLINTQPTTLAGIVAAIQHIRIQMSDDGIYMPQNLVLDTGGDAQRTMNWIDTFLDTTVDAATALIGRAA